MRKGTEVAVIGGGVIGATIAYQLVRCGRDTVLVEQEPRLEVAGATGPSAGLIRLSHTSVPAMQLAVAGRTVYRQWREVVGGDCGYQATGFALLVGPDQVSHLRLNTQVLLGLGARVLLLAPNDFGRLQPRSRWRLDDVGAIAWEPESGYADPPRATRALLHQGRALGLRLVPARATGIELRGGRVDGIRTTEGFLGADWVVIAAGLGSQALVNGHGLKLPLEARLIATCDLRQSTIGSDFCTCIDDVGGTYFRPDGDGLRVGVRLEKTVAAGSTLSIGPLELGNARRRVAHRIPALSTAMVAGVQSGWDVYTPDRHPLIGKIAELPGVYLATGFSGGGFKIAPAVGRFVAEELAGGCPRPELEPFRPDRFRLEAPISAAYAYQHM